MKGARTVEVELDPGWTVGDRPHGGYLLATVSAQGLDEAHPHPLAVSAHYLAPPVPGRAQVEVERTRTGRRVASSRLRLVQDGAPLLDVLLTSGRHDAAAAPYWADGGPLALPDVGQCARTPPRRQDGVPVGFLEHVDLRMDPATVGYADTHRTDTAVNRAWLRRADGTGPSPVDLLLFADALPPVTFGLGLGGWVPTVELTVLVRGLPAPGWCRAEQRARLLQDGWVDQECEVWDSAGRLVAQARQLAGYRLPG
ncbi:MAG: thioesterase family protein [Actinomycetota bacterium]|nr:thioesterase family protein [Actinomycetota bacterium]